MRAWIADLHVHTLLSPCAAIEMTPERIIYMAAQNGIDIVAITDHNVSDNVVAALKAAEKYGVVVWPGVEVESVEGGHIVVLFDKIRNLKKFQDILDDNMSDMRNDAEKFGAQFVVDENNEFVREEERMLLTSVKLDADSVIAYAEKFEGIAVVAHVDRPAYSLLSYLGFISADMGFAAVEISRNSLKELKENKIKKMVGFLPYITNSDAHFMEEFLNGPKNKIYMKEASIKEFKLALKNEGGRHVLAGHMLQI